MRPVDIRKREVWFVETEEIAKFLDLTYRNHHGEIWLYNNDLNVFRDKLAFESIYLDRVCNVHARNIDAVKILLPPKLFEEVRTEQPEWFKDRLEQIYHNVGDAILSRFCFGVIGTSVAEQLSKFSLGAENAWIFYTHGAVLSSNAGMAMIRDRQFPFTGPEERTVSMAWLVKDQTTLQQRLQRAFEKVFTDPKNFFWVRPIANSRSKTFSYSLKPGRSPAYITRRSSRTKAPYSFPPLALGDKVDIAIVTALEEEMTEVEKVLEVIPLRSPVPGDNDCYFPHTNSWGHQRHVLVARIGAMGGVAAAIATQKMLERWRPTHVVLCGVAAGDPRAKSKGEQELGDVVAGLVVCGYDLGVLSTHSTEYRGHKYSPGSQWTNAVELATRDWRAVCASQMSPSGTTLRQIQIHHEPIASGSTLVKDGEFLGRLERAGLHGKLRALEMEGDGVGFACENFHPKASLLVIKGIMDFGDEETRADRDKDKWKAVAARNAARFLREVLSKFKGANEF